jgi:hypothetical protein
MSCGCRISYDGDFPKSLDRPLWPPWSLSKNPFRFEKRDRIERLHFFYVPYEYTGTGRRIFESGSSSPTAVYSAFASDQSEAEKACDVSLPETVFQDSWFRSLLCSSYSLSVRDSSYPTLGTRIFCVNALSHTFSRDLFISLVNLQWTPAGDAFIIGSDLNRLESETLPQYFRHNRFQSLVRQVSNSL